MTVPFDLLLKPAGADCNLRCGYCFYLDKAALYPQAKRRMTPAVLEAVVRGYLTLPQPVHAFCWQGGEPLLMGPDFYAEVVRLQHRYAAPGAVVANSLQTNAVLVDEALAGRLADWSFLAGCSLDGPPDVHDRFRRGPDGGGTHAAVMRGVERLRGAGVAVNVLTLVTTANANRGAEIYRYLRAEGFAHLQFIPCADGGAGASVDGEAWGRFLCDVFDAWWPRDVGHVSIRQFEATAAKLAHGWDLVCTAAAACGQYLVVEHNGDVYPCDFYVEPDHRLGNVLDTPLAAIATDPRRRAFGAAKAILPADCLDCAQREICGGDCPRNRPSGEASRLCAGWRRFYEHTGPRIAELVRLARERDA